MKKTFTLIGLVLIAAISLSAQAYIKTKTHQDAMSMMGQNQPAKDSFSEQYIGGDTYAMVSEDQTIAINLKKNIGLIVDHKTKTYVESTLPIDMTKLVPPEAAAFAGTMKMTATVTPSGETKKVGQWNCAGYNVNMSVMGMSMTMKVWASTDVPFDYNAYNAKFMTYALKGMGPMIDENMIKEMMKIKGFQIATEMDMFGMKMATEVVEISKKSAPANLFTPPAGYTKK